MSELITDATIVLAGSQHGEDRAKFAAQAFLVRYRNDQTRYSYGLVLRQWFGWCAENDVAPLEAQRVHIELFARELEATGRKISTVAIKLNALAGFYRFAMADGVIAKDPMVHVMRPQIERESTTIGLTRPELNDLIRASRASTPQDHAVIHVLGYNGLRVGELCGIDIEHLGEHRGAPTVLILRKGGRRQVIPFAFSTWYGIQRVMESHPTGRGPLFLTAEGNRLDRKGADRIVKRMYVAAGIAKRGHPHALRHTFVTLSRDAGESDRDIQSSTGHRDGRMLDYYDRARHEPERNVTHGLASFVERAG